MQAPAESKTNKAAKIKSVFFTAAGTIFLCLGAIGIFLPILPTTPFLLLAAACYVKGSARMSFWLNNNKLFGSYLRNYREGKGMSAKGKVFSLTLLWATMLYAVFFMTNVLAYQVVMLIVPAGVSFHLLRIPTCKKPKAEIIEKQT
jgi:uncharacterized protein